MLLLSISVLLGLARTGPSYPPEPAHQDAALAARADELLPKDPAEVLRWLEPR